MSQMRLVQLTVEMKHYTNTYYIKIINISYAYRASDLSTIYYYSLSIRSVRKKCVLIKRQLCSLTSICPSRKLTFPDLCP